MGDHGHRDAMMERFKAARHGMSAFETWQMFTYLSAYDIAIACGNDVSFMEDTVSAIRSRDAGQVSELRAMLSEMVEEYESNMFQDLLGDVYMQLGIGNEAGGQFFTPYGICQLMAKMDMGAKAVEDAIADHGFVTVNEPSCGAGANVVAACERMHELGHNYQERMLAWCNDVSEMTALMCYVQLSLIGCPAVVTIGDTLSMGFRSPLRTPVLMVGGVWAARRMGGCEWAML